MGQAGDIKPLLAGKHKFMPVKELSKSAGGSKGQPRHWDDPNGLGWKLWRRAHSTGLSSSRIQKIIGLMHTNTLVAHNPLMADIHRRWGLNQKRAGGGYSLGFPLVVARFSPFYPQAHHQELPLPSSQMGRPSAAAVSISASGPSRLSKTAEPSEALGAARTIQPAQAMDYGLAQHGSNMDRGYQRPGGSDGFKGYDGFEGSNRTSADQTAGLVLSLQRSKPAAEVNVTQNETFKPIEAPRSGAATKVNLQRSAQPALSKSAPAQAAAEATTKKTTFETMPVASMHPYGRRTSSSTGNQNRPSSPLPISRGNQSPEVQSFPAYPGSFLFSNAIRRQHMQLPRSERKSMLMPSAGVAQTGALIFRSKAGVALQRSPFNPSPVHFAIPKTPLRREITDRLEHVRGGDELMPVILRSPYGGATSTSKAIGRQPHRGGHLSLHGLKKAGIEDVLSSSSPKSPYPLSALQAAHFSITPLARSVSSGPRKGTALAVADASDRWVVQPGRSAMRRQGHRDPIALLTHQSQLQASPLIGSLVPVAGNKVLPASPMLYSMPAASLRKATPFAKEKFSRPAGGRNAAPAALMTMPGMVPTIPGRGKARPVRQRDRIETASDEDGLPSRVVSRAPAISTTLADGPSGRQAKHKEFARNYAADATEVAAGQSGIPQLKEPLVTADRATLYRQQYHPAERHIKFNQQVDGGPGGGVGQPRWAPGIMPLSQLHQDRISDRHPDAFQPIAGTVSSLDIRGSALQVRNTAETLYSAMRLPMPVSNMVRRQAAGHPKDIKNEIPSSAINNSGSAISANGSAISANGRTGAAVPETNADTGSMNLNFSADPLNTSFSGFVSGRNLFQRPSVRPMEMQAFANREVLQSAGAYRLPDQSSDLRTAVTRQAVYPRLILRRAGGEDAQSRGPTTPEIATPIGAGPVVSQLWPSLALKLQISRHETSPATMMGKTTYEERMGLFRQTVYPGSTIRPAAREDTHSGEAAASANATLVGAWPFMPQLWPSQSFKSQTSHHETSPETMMGKTTYERAGLFRQAEQHGLILRLATGKEPRAGGPAIPGISSPIGAFPITGGLSGLLPLKLPSRRSEASSAPLKDKSLHEMPLFYNSTANTSGATGTDQQAHRSVVPDRPGQLTARNMTPVASVLEPQNLPETPAAFGRETDAAGSQMDPDELVEKIWQKIMRRLTIEQERRGLSPWV